MILKRDDRGATAIEYSLLAGVIALGIIASLVSTKKSLTTNFDKISYSLGSSVPKAPSAPRVVASTSTVSTTLNGTVLTQNYKTYTDGTKSMVQTNSNPTAVGYGTVDYEFDTAGNVISAYVRNPDGSFQYSEAVSALRGNTSVRTITTADGNSYSYSQTRTIANSVVTNDNAMLDPGSNKNLWTTQTVTADYSNPANTVTSVSCTYGTGPSVACR